ncbi:hypothetical protein V475_01630 [Sphingobium baderi LL03]|jgi:hypothetical protein|uniref:Uncharacterized protein n=1 Tax=Sphingobium baderi LL03 TaxID=1114964 RepID=T0GC56_9SPHN|nr:hypothetical protein L485_20495 [Sphingobium baderi LL03]KMS63743.1 hypothetical protein V475_01630 [Sphingobium baderi LL03]
MAPVIVLAGKRLMDAWGADKPLLALRRGQPI